MVSIDPKTAGTVSPPLLDRIPEFSILTSVEKGDGYRPAPSRRLLKQDPPLRAPYQGDIILQLAQAASEGSPYVDLIPTAQTRQLLGPGLFASAGTSVHTLSFVGTVGDTAFTLEDPLQIRIRVVDGKILPAAEGRELIGYFEDKAQGPELYKIRVGLHTQGLGLQVARSWLAPVYFGFRFGFGDSDVVFEKLQSGYDKISLEPYRVPSFKGKTLDAASPRYKDLAGELGILFPGQNIVQIEEAPGRGGTTLIRVHFPKDVILALQREENRDIVAYEFVKGDAALELLVDQRRLPKVIAGLEVEHAGRKGLLAISSGLSRRGTEGDAVQFADATERIRLRYGEGRLILMLSKPKAFSMPPPPPPPANPEVPAEGSKANPPRSQGLLSKAQIRSVQEFITHFQLHPDNLRTIMTLEHYLQQVFLRAVGTRFPNPDNVFNDISRSVTDLDFDSRAAGFSPMSEAFLAAYMAIATDLYIGHNLWLATQARARGEREFNFDQRAAKEIFSTAYRSAIFVMEGPDSPRLASVTRFQVERVLDTFEELNRDAPVAVRDVLVQEGRFPVTVEQVKDRLSRYLRDCWAALAEAPGSFETGPLIDVLEQEATRRVEAFLEDDGWTNAYSPYMDYLTAVAMIRFALALAPRGPLFVPVFSDNDPVIVDLNRYLENQLEDGAIFRETFPWAVAIAMGGTQSSSSELITVAEWRALRNRLTPELRAALPERPPQNFWALEGRLQAYYEARIFAPSGEFTMIMAGIFVQLMDLAQNGEPINPAFRIIYETFMIEKLAQTRESSSGGGSFASDMDKFTRDIVPSLAGASILSFRATRRLLGRTDPAFNREELTLIARLVLSDLQKYRGGQVHSPFLETFLEGNEPYPRTPEALKTLIDTQLAELPSPPPPVTTILSARLLKANGDLAHVVEAAIGIYNTAFLIEAAAHTGQGAEGADTYQRALQAAAHYSAVFCKDVLGLDGVVVSPHPRHVPPAGAIDRTGMARTQFIDPSYLEAALNEVDDPRLVGAIMIGGYPQTFEALDERLTAHMYERLRGISPNAIAIASDFETVCSVAEQGRFASASQAALMRILYVNAALEKPRAFVAAWEAQTPGPYLAERVSPQAVARAEAYVSERSGGLTAEETRLKEVPREEGGKATEPLLRDLLKPKGKK